MKSIRALVLIIAAMTAPAAHAADADFYPILPWETPWSRPGMFDDPKVGVSSLRDCGFTTAAFATAEQVPLCEKAGLRAIVGPAKKEVDWRKLSDEQIEQSVQQLVGTTAGSDAVIGYFLMDEPGAQYFPALAKAVAAVKKLAPGKIAYINLFPNYATLGAPNLSQLGTATFTEYLERYVAEVKPQFISYDNYQVEFSNDLADAGKTSLYFTNLLEVRRVALEHKLPFWNIVSSNQIRPETTIPSPANLGLQAYTTLAAGARGLTWYTYYAKRYHYAPIDDNNNRTATWAYLKSVNEQVKVLGPIMNRLASTGVYFTSPPPGASLPVLPGKVVESLTPSPAARAMVGEFVDDSGRPYVMLVNLSLERSSRFTLKTGKAYQKILAASPADGSFAPLPDSHENSIWLPGGQGALLRFE